MQEENKTNKREQVFDLEKYVGKEVRITFFGGIEVSGRLVGYDQLLNIVLEKGKVVEFISTEGGTAIDPCTEPPSSMMCKGVSICSIDLLGAPEAAEQCEYEENAYYTI